jgi:hypothetical protein
MKFLATLVVLPAILFLYGCAPEIDATVYIQDVYDVIDDQEPVEVPMTLRIPQSSLKKCNEDLDDIVYALELFLTVGENTKCISDGMNNFAELETVLVVEKYAPRGNSQPTLSSSLGSQGETLPLVYVGVAELENVEGGYSLKITPSLSSDQIELTLRSNDKFRFMPGHDVPVFNIKIDNDSRDKIVFQANHAFVNQEPNPNSGTIELERRGTASVRLSDVASSYLQLGLPYEFAFLQFTSTQAD